MERIWDYIDKFRPMIRDHQDTSIIFRSRLFIITNFFIIIFTSLLCLIEQIFHLNIRPELIIFMFGQSLLFLAIHKKYNFVGLLIFVEMMSFLFVCMSSIILAGAYVNTIIYWFPIIPLVVCFIGGKKYGALSTAFVLFSIYLIYENLRHNSFILRDGLTVEKFMSLQNIHLLMICIFVFLISIVFIQTQSNLERNMERIRNKMEENSKSFLITRMSAGISHEINNPLCAIRFANEVIRMSSNPEKFDKDKINKMADKIDASIDRAVNVIDALKSIGQERDDRSFKYISIEELINDLRRMYKTDMITDKIEFLIQNETLVSDQIFCYKEKIIEALIHLINNAVYIARSYPVDKRKIVLTVEKEESFYKFSVIDPGNGIDGAILTNIFDPFYTTKKVNEGMGLGLTLVSAIAKTHSGRIDYDIKNGQTRFTLRLGII